MGLLTPSEAAAIARGVYRLREDSVSAVHERGQTLGCEGLFALGDPDEWMVLVMTHDALRVDPLA